MSFATDLAGIFSSTNPMASAVVFSETTFYGQLDQDYFETLDVSTVVPLLSMKTSDLGAITFDSAITVGGVSYKVKEIRQATGDGLVTELVLEEQ